MNSAKEIAVPVTQDQLSAVIDAGCEFEGRLCFNGIVRINGIFRGEIFTPDTLIIGEGARVFADIEAGVVMMSGELEGTVRAKHRVEIHNPAIFRGDLHTPSLKIEEGVIFEGSSSMSSS